MRGYALHILLGFLAFVLCVVLGVLFFQTRVKSPGFTLEKYETNFSLPKQFFDSWRDKMAKLAMKDYQPAVSEFYLNFPVRLQKEEKKRRVYRLQINSDSFYSRFCLLQTLSSFKIPFKLTQGVKGTQIYLNTDNKKLMDNIILKLAEYKIHATSTEIWL